MSVLYNVSRIPLTFRYLLLHEHHSHYLPFQKASIFVFYIVKAIDGFQFRLRALVKSCDVTLSVLWLFLWTNFSVQMTDLQYVLITFPFH